MYIQYMFSINNIYQPERQSEAEGKGETRIYTQKDISNHTNTLEAIHHSKTHHSTHTQRTHRHIDTHMHARKYNT